MKANEKRFLVYNLTDGVLAHPELLTLAEARSLIRGFARRFTRQGYYLTASGGRIDPEAVELEIVDAGQDPPRGLGMSIQSTLAGW
jgi:hypothetical protein